MGMPCCNTSRINQTHRLVARKRNSLAGIKIWRASSSGRGSEARPLVRTDGEHWGAIMQLLRAYYPNVKTMHWQFSHGELSAIPTPMEFRLIPM